MTSYLFPLLTLALLAGCMPERRERQQSPALQTEMRTKKLKRLSQAEITAACLEEGKHLASELNAVLVLGNGVACDSARMVGMVRSAVLVDYDFVCNDQASMPEKAKQVWTAYQESLKNNLPVGDNLQKMGDTLMLYTVPVQNEGRFVGMWSIVMDKREVIKLM
jgi:hypothetical protein